MPARGTRRLVLACLLLGLPLILPGVSAETELPSRKQRWLELRSPHFRVYSEDDEKGARDVVQELESLRVLCRGLSPHFRDKPDAPSVVPTAVYLFKRARSFEPYHAGKPDVIGFYVPRTEFGPQMAILARRGVTPETARHEYIHEFMAQNMPRLPRWVSEGLSEFYSTMRLGDGVVALGLPVPNATAMALRRPVAVDDLVLGGQKVLWEAPAYANAWALVHFMLVPDPARRAAFARYVDGVAGGKDAAVAFREAFGKLPHELNRAYLDYLRGLARRVEYWKVPLAATAVPGAGPARTMGYDEVLAALGLLEPTGTRDLERTRALFEAALAENPQNANALRGLATLERTSGGAVSEATLRRFRAALAADGSNPRVHLWFAEALDVPETAVDAARAREAQGHLEQALELDPSDIPAKALLGHVLALHLGERERGVKLLDDAVASGTAGPATRALFTYIALGEFDRARAVLNGAALTERALTERALTEPALVKLGRRTLAEAEGRRAKELAALPGREEEAKRLHEQALADAPE